MSHQTSISPGSRLYQLYGAKYRTLSFHHQAVDKVGKGLKVVQRSTKDNVAEGIEHETLPIYGVQWHPELDYTTGKILLQDFLNRCKEYRGT